MNDESIYKDWQGLRVRINHLMRDYKACVCTPHMCARVLSFVPHTSRTYMSGSGLIAPKSHVKELLQLHLTI